MQLDNFPRRRLIGAAALACAAALIPGAAFAATAARPVGHHLAVSAAAQSRAGTWTKLPAAPITKLPTGGIVSVWTGHEMIIHGFNFGARGVTFAYRPATRTRVRLANSPSSPAVETRDVALWTGSRMLVLGLTSAIYNPATNTWRAMPRPGMPLPGEVTAWTGRQVLTFGGACCLATSNTGAAYTLATNTWRPIPAAPFKTRDGAMGAWTGKELVVAGGSCCPPVFTHQTTFRDGAAYHPATRTWRKLPRMPGRRTGGTAVWDGKEVLFIGAYRPVGGNGFSLSASGLAYNPATNQWRWLPAMPFPRTGFAAVWDGRQLLVWGGLTAKGVPAPHGEAYTPATNRWTALPAAPLRGRADPVAVWTGRQMIVWGGYSIAGYGGKSYTDGRPTRPPRGNRADHGRTSGVIPFLRRGRARQRADGDAAVRVLLGPEQAAIQSATATRRRPEGGDH